MTITLIAQNRDAAQDANLAREAGKIPAVYYGAGKEAAAITVEYGDFIKMYREAGESTMITLKTDAGDMPVLVQDIQLDPVSNKITHVDFKVVDTTKTIEVTVPINFVGASPAASSSMGTITKVLHDLDIEVLPANLPHAIDVSLDSLANIDDQVTVADIVVPKGVTILNDKDQTVVVVSPLKDDSDLETTGTVDFSQIEVEKKGKEEKAEDAE